VKEWLGTAARLVTGIVWIVAGGLKLSDPYASVEAVRAYDLLPESVVPTVGHLLPVLEVVLGGLLVLGLVTRGAAVVSALLLVAFIVGIASVWSRGIEIECGCFGGGGAKAGAASAYPWELARDSGLLLLSAYLVWLRRSRLALDAMLLPDHDDPDNDTDDDTDLADRATESAGA
jgi:uncharacterized membrane protein YphA (DoxX/SURF4 family)